MCSSPGPSVIGEVMILLRSAWIPFLICAKIARLGVGGGRSPGFGSGSGSGWTGALGRVFKVKISFPGPGRLSLRGNPILLVSFTFDGSPYYVANAGVSSTVVVRNNFKTSINLK